MSEKSLCQLCGEPMPEGEEMFNYHGYSGPCPKQPLPKAPAAAESLGAADGLELECYKWLESRYGMVSAKDTYDLAAFIRARELALRQRVEGERALREVFEQDKYVEMSKAIDAENKMLALRQRSRELLFKYGFQSVLCGFDGESFYYCKECKFDEARPAETMHDHYAKTKELVRHSDDCQLQAILGKQFGEQGEKR